MTTNKTQATGTPPAEVEALIQRIDGYYHHIIYPHSPSPEYLRDLLDDSRATLRTLSARIAELEQKESFHLRDFGFVADQYQSADAECGVLRDRIAELEEQVEQASADSAKWENIQLQYERFLFGTREGAERVWREASKICRSHPEKIGPDVVDALRDVAMGIEGPEYASTADQIKAAAAKAERAKCVGELREYPNRYGTDMYDRSYYNAAADHLEANGRDQV